MIDGKKVILIKTYTFESGLWYLAKSLGNKLMEEGHTVIYIPKSKYTFENRFYRRGYIEPNNPDEFDREIIQKFTNNKPISQQVLTAIVKYGANYVISFETLMEKSQWIPEVRNKTGAKIIDVPMVEWVTPRFLKGKSYMIFDEIWALTDLCFEKFSGYPNVRRINWDFVDRNLFYKDDRGIFEPLGAKYYHAASLNPDYSTKNTGKVLEAKKIKE